MRTFDPVSLYYITHIDNLPSILDKGILADAKLIPQYLTESYLLAHQET